MHGLLYLSSSCLYTLFWRIICVTHIQLQSLHSISDSFPGQFKSLFCFQGARAVVSARTYADFTPQATFDIKVILWDCQAFQKCTVLNLVCSRSIVLSQWLIKKQPLTKPAPPVFSFEKYYWCNPLGNSHCWNEWCGAACHSAPCPHTRSCDTEITRLAHWFLSIWVVHWSSWWQCRRCSPFMCFY